MKVFRKTALLISVIVLAVVLAVGAVAGAALLSEGNETLGEEYSAVQVTTDGKVNLKVYYSTLGSAQAFVATVTDPVSGEVETYNYTLEEIGEATAYGYCVKVPLAPSQMTHTVEVWATKGDEKSDFVYKTTVVDYANEALANPDHAQFHDAMRALLNWGAMAQVFFDTDGETGTLANEDVFARSTNPMSVVTAASTDVANTGSGDDIFTEANVSLEPGNITMKISFALSDADASAITAYYSRKNVTKQALDVVADGENYAVTIKNIAVNNWNEDYTVTVEYGEGTYSYTYSLMNYLTYQLENGGDAVKNVAKTMFQFYQQALAAKDEYEFTDCAHEEGIFWISNGDGTDSYKCPVCYAQYANVKVPEEVTKYCSAYDFAKGATEYYNKNTATFTLNDGDPYGTSDGNLLILWSRIQADYTGNTGTHLDKIFADVGNAEYLVVKARVAADTESNLSVTLSTAGKNGNPDGDDADTYPDTKGYKSVTLVSKGKGDGKWHTYVIDLKALLGDYWAKEEGAESYVVDTFYLACGGTFDVAYMAFVDGGDNECAAIDALVDEETIYKLTSASGGAYVELNTADHTCAGAHAWDGKETVEGHTYSYNCAQCGECLISRTLEDSVKLYFSPYKISKKGTGDPTNARDHYKLANKAFTIDNEAYFSFTGEDNYAQLIWNRTDHGSAQAYKMDIGLANYAVIKMRLSGTPAKNIKLYYGTAGDAGDVTYTTLPVAASTTGKWATYVIDLAKVFGEYHVLNAESNTYEIDNLYWDSGDLLKSTTKVDVAYIAFVEGDLAEVAKLVDTDTALLQTANKGAATVVSGETGECVIHTADLTSDAQTRVEGENTTYYYTCSTCGGECYAKTVPTTSAYLGPKYATQAATYSNTNNSGLAIADGNVVGRVTGKTTSDYQQVIWLRNENDMSTNQYTKPEENQTVNIGKAKYLILKVQVNGADLTHWDVTFSTTGYNRVLSEQTTPMVRNSSYYYVDAEGTEHALKKADVDKGTVSPEEGWTQKMVNVVSKDGMQSFKLPTAAVEQGEWVVFAIDLQTVLSKSFVADESGDYIIDSFYTTFKGLAAGATMDYAYFAYAEDWQGVDDIVDEATLIEVTDTKGSYNVVNVADHSTVAE